MPPARVGFVRALNWYLRCVGNAECHWLALIVADAADASGCASRERMLTRHVARLHQTIEAKGWTTSLLRANQVCQGCSPSRTLRCMGFSNMGFGLRGLQVHDLLLQTVPGKLNDELITSDAMRGMAGKLRVIGNQRL